MTVAGQTKEVFFHCASCLQPYSKLSAREAESVKDLSVYRKLNRKPPRMNTPQLCDRSTSLASLAKHPALTWRPGDFRSTGTTCLVEFSALSIVLVPCRCFLVALVSQMPSLPTLSKCSAGQLWPAMHAPISLGSQAVGTELLLH